MQLAQMMLAAWAALAWAAWPYAVLTTWLLMLAALITRTIQASPKAYATEARVTNVEQTYLPAAVQPGSSPAITETWHDFPAFGNGWGRGTGGYGKYRLTAEGDCQVAIWLTATGTRTDGTVIMFTPGAGSAYSPTTAKNLPVIVNPNALSSNWTPMMQFRSDGSIAVFGVNAASLNEISCHGIIPVSSGV